MIWIYRMLDFITTISQGLIAFAVAETLCRKARTKCSRWLPPIIFLMATFFWSWYIIDASYKIPCLVAILFFSYLLCYEVSIQTSVITAFMACVFAGTIEIVTIWIAEKFNFPQTIIVDGIAMASGPIYLLCLILTILSVAILYWLFSDFHYQLDNRNFIVVFLFEGAALLLYHLSIVQKIKGGIHGVFQPQIDMLIIVVGISFAVVFLYIKNNAYLKEMEQQAKTQLVLLEQQYNYYQEKLRDEERVRAIYHDMKNHLLILENQQNTEETHQMAEKLRLQITCYEDYVHTGNDFLDVILKDKAEKMREKEIDFSAVIDFGDVDFIEPLDISTIFGNALDNAIEASEKLPVSQRMITVKAACIRNMLVISVVNNIVAETVITEKTTKTDGFLHGFGLSNIRQSAEKYGGTCTTEQENGRFMLKILLPVAERKAVE